MNSKSIDEIKVLLARFYDGLTTEAEEARLRDLLDDEHVPDELKDDKALLDALSAEADVPDGLEERLSAAIDARAAAEAASKPRVRIVSFRRMMSVAASVAVVVALVLGLNRGGGAEECDDMDVAYAATEKALSIFASAINRGAEGVSTAEQVSNRAFDVAQVCVNGNLNK